ncbi:MAG: YfhO family protein [Planctomycetes bacterium]|nr:YfhO family protein [Planctomycetota bacterium]
MRIGERTKDAIYITALFILTIIFFEQMIFHNKILLLRDTFCDYVPWRNFARESIRNGVMPLWNPYSSLGQPFIAFPQTAVFYPLNLMFYTLPIITALRWFIVLHIFLAGVFMYILMRHWNVVRIAAFVSAIVFMFNGMIISRLEFLTIISTIVWVPLLFYLLDSAIEKRSLWYGCITGITMSIQILAGHSQTFYYVYLSLGLYWIAMIMLNAFATKDIKSILKPLFILPLATIVAVTLSMIQLLPALELTGLSFRAENFNPQMQDASLHPFHLFTFLIPYLFGIPGYMNVFWGITLAEFWMGSFYVGIFSLILSFLAMIVSFFHKRCKMLNAYSCNNGCANNFKLTAFFSALTILLILLASGIYTPVYSVFYAYIPFFDKFRWPSRIMEMAVFSLTIVAGIGTHYFFSIIQNTKNIHGKGTDSCLRLVLKILVISDAIIIILFLLGLFIPTKILPLITEYINTINFETIPTSLETRYSQMIMGYMYMLIFLNAGIILFILGITRMINYKTIHVLIPLIIVSDLFFMFKDLNYYSNADVYESKPDRINYFESDKDLFRVGSLYGKSQQILYGLRDESAFLWAKSVLIGETSLSNHIFKILGGGELKINTHMEFMNFLTAISNSSNKIRNNILKVLNVKYTIVSEDMSKRVDYNLFNKAIILKYDKHFLRIFVVGKATVLNNKDEIFGKLSSEGFDPFSEIIVESRNVDVKDLSSAGKEIKYEIKKIDYSPNKINIDIELDNNGFLVLSDTYYPGWKAHIDDKETVIYKTDYILRSIFLEKGTHNVEFVYDPVSFKIGYITTLSTLFILFVFGILKYYKPVSKRIYLLSHGNN